MLNLTPHTGSGQLSPSLAAGSALVTSLIANCLFSLVPSLFHGLAAARGIILFSSPPASRIPLIISFLPLSGLDTQGTTQFPQLVGLPLSSPKLEPGNNRVELLLVLGRETEASGLPAASVFAADSSSEAVLQSPHDGSVL